MSRAVNKKRPEELRAAIVRYLTRHGLSDLSLRPLAKAVGSSPRVLLYYFGSKEKLLAEVMVEIRHHQAVALSEVEGASWQEACQLVWRRISAPDSKPFFLLFFEAYGIAIRNPRRYKNFLNDTVESWLTFISGPLSANGCSLFEARAFATVVLAGLRGFMLDLCNTGDRKRVDRAVRLWTGTLDRMLREDKRTRE